MAVSGNIVVVGAPEEDSNGLNAPSDNSAFQSGAAYIFFRTGNKWTQQAYLKATDARAQDLFGWSVAISDDTVVVGAPGEDNNAGAAFVFVRSGATWSQQARLKASNTEKADRFGESVAVSGDTIVIGAPYEASNATAVNGNETNNDATDSGAAYVFKRSGTTWTQQAYLKALNTGLFDNFGSSVGVADDVLVVGAREEASNATGVNGDEHNDEAPGSGAAYVFGRAGLGWSQQAYLKASNSEKYDRFGASVAVSASTIVVGAPFEASDATEVNGDQNNNNSVSSGAAYVFARDATLRWKQQAYLKASNAEVADQFGKAVAVSDATVVVGAHFESSSAIGVNHPTGQANNDAYGSGAAYVFRRESATWRQNAYIKASNTGRGAHSSDPGDFFGQAVGASSGIIVVGAPRERSNATRVDGDQGNNNAYEAGAAYVFTETAPGSYFSIPSKGNRLDFGITAGGALSLFIANMGANDLVIESIDDGGILSSDGVSHIARNLNGEIVEFPHTIRVGFPNDGLEVRVQWFPIADPDDEFNLNGKLRVTTNDPSTPIAIYDLVGVTQEFSAEQSPEGAIFDAINEAFNRSQFPSAASISKKARLDRAETATFILQPDAVRSLTAEIPSFLGGGSVQLDNFTGSFRVSLLSFPNDTSRAFIRVESGSFTAPSFRLPGGLDTGPNLLTFGAPEQSEGILLLATGSYTASATATIVNRLFPDGVIVRGEYSGVYKAATGELSLQSDSRDLFTVTDRILCSPAPNGPWLTWVGTSALEGATDILGPWQTVPNGASPYRVNLTSDQQFFRLRKPAP